MRFIHRVSLSRRNPSNLSNVLTRHDTTRPDPSGFEFAWHDTRGCSRFHAACGTFLSPKAKLGRSGETVNQCADDEWCSSSCDLGTLSRPEPEPQTLNSAVSFSPRPRALLKTNQPPLRGRKSQLQQTASPTNYRRACVQGAKHCNKLFVG